MERGGPPGGIERRSALAIAGATAGAFAYIVLGLVLPFVVGPVALLAAVLIAVLLLPARRRARRTPRPRSRIALGPVDPRARRDERVDLPMWLVLVLALILASAGFGVVMAVLEPEVAGPASGKPRGPASGTGVTDAPARIRQVLQMGV